MKIIKSTKHYSVVYHNFLGRKTRSFKTIIEALDFSVFYVAEYVTSVHSDVLYYLKRHDHDFKRKGGYNEFIVS